MNVAAFLVSAVVCVPHFVPVRKLCTRLTRAGSGASGQAGELLVQEQLLLYGIESAAERRDGKAVHDYAFQGYLLENRVGRVM